MKLNFWHNGDGSVGIGGESAVVEFDGDGYDADFVRAAKELLLPAFQELFDFRTHVATDEEIKRMEGE